MFLGPYKLFDIINLGIVKQLQITKITFDLESKLNHIMKSKEYDIGDNTLDTCKEYNEEQFITLTESIEDVRGYLSANPDSTKRKNQLEYLSNTLDHFITWYEDKKLSLPDFSTLMPNKNGIFSGNLDFSIISIGQTIYRLSESQSKIVKALYESTAEGVDGLTYQEIANRAGLTSSSRLSSYFQSELRWNDLLKHSRQNRRYSLITE